MADSNALRSSFLDHFRAAGHSIVPSAPLVPQSDPTLMFVNAGMVPFKNMFTGVETPPALTAASSQKCVRAGGKHNDLDNVGYTSRHHTFFEMLGNFSFGDYFKEQAISHAWSLLTGEWGLPKDRLLVTVYHDDEEAFGLWRKIAGLGEDRIVRIATQDNFWSMGPTGPCGPCSEIFYDHGAAIAGGPPGSPDEDGDRWVEIWNLVFMQHDQQEDGSRLNLPSPSIDTGMGLERISAVMQGTHDNFAIHLFRAIIEASAELTQTDPDGDQRVSHRVIADHLRASAFLIADGVLPSNDGRGYVLRRIMRRAMRHAHLAGAKDPLMHQLVDVLIGRMGGAYGELVRAGSLIKETLREEEERFRVTLDKGLRLLEEELRHVPEGGTMNGAVAFKLYDTFGFPLDLTVDALRSQGRKLDEPGFEAAMNEQKERARAAWSGSGAAATDDLWFDLSGRIGPTEFLGYATTRGAGEIRAIIVDGAPVERVAAGQAALIITNQTPFYGESGGQIGDAGTLSSASGARAQVSATSKPLGLLHVHHCMVDSGSLTVGETVTLEVDEARRNSVRAHHSATHLLHEALRRVLGEHVSQKGSMVAPDRLRFDFSHPRPLTDEQVQAIEADVNAMIQQNREVTTRVMTPDAAIEAGALALFGEKYGDEVRVVSMGEDAAGRAGRFSTELCGGTHVDRLGDIALLRILGHSAVASGVRRIEAVVGEAARRYLADQDDRLKQLAASLKTSPADLGDRLAALMDERKRLDKELADARRQLALGGGSGGQGGDAREDVGGIAFIGQISDAISAKDLRSVIDDARKQMGSGIAAIVTTEGGKASVAVGVSDDLVGRFDAVEFVQLAVAQLGGKGGGGKPNMAQGGGPDAAAASAAVDAIRVLIAERAKAAA